MRQFLPSDGDSVKLHIKSEIEVNDKDHSRCSIRCQHIAKVKGNYRCLLYDEQVDTGEDDEIGYGFKRSNHCINNELQVFG